MTSVYEIEDASFESVSIHANTAWDTHTLLHIHPMCCDTCVLTGVRYFRGNFLCRRCPCTCNNNINLTLSSRRWSGLLCFAKFRDLLPYLDDQLPLTVLAVHPSPAVQTYRVLYDIKKTYLLKNRSKATTSYGRKLGYTVAENRAQWLMNYAREILALLVPLTKL